MSIATQRLKGSFMKRFLLTAIAGVSMAATANAAVLGFDFVPVPDDGNQPAGINTFDLVVETDSDFTIYAFQLTLTQGFIYNDPTFGTANPPGAFVGAVPALAYDTFFSDGTNSDMINAGPSFFTPSPFYVPNPTGADNANSSVLAVDGFNTALGQIGFTSIARISISDDAVGTFATYTTATPSYIGSAGANDVLLDAFALWFVDGGQFQLIPEPATMALLGLGGLTLLRRRRA